MTQINLNCLWTCSYTTLFILYLTCVSQTSFTCSVLRKELSKEQNQPKNTTHSKRKPCFKATDRKGFSLLRCVCTHASKSVNIFSPNVFHNEAKTTCQHVQISVLLCHNSWYSKPQWPLWTIYWSAECPHSWT